MMRFITGILTIGLAWQSSLSPSFESASIKPSSPDAHGSHSNFSAGMIRLENEPLRYLVRLAYGVPDAQITGGPKWIDSEMFDVIAKADSNASTSELLAMLQTLLAERCKLAIHRESRLIPGYSLTIAKGGIKAKAGDALSSNVR